ncbi:protein FAM228A isoform X2 [Kryptolebias marmoratus]|uniref:protein FAM228A isoform X2 n=1 Tax=Kryptolebias marmoratus TaxID=37003 RepID=UPI0018ACF9C1|nr:protein FAM228A isoform X2 [Kryptolebias marmoratus]
MRQESIADVKKVTEKMRSLSQPNARKTGSCQSVRSKKRNEESSKRDRLFDMSLRQLQAKIEAENQQVQEIIQPLLDAETGFMKLECFLTQRDVAELRRKELLHKRWTERVWLPLQRRVEEHVSSCRSLEGRRRRSVYSDYLRHCNSKGFVFLETYDLQEYNPFLLSVRKPQHFKLETAGLNDASCLRIQEKNRKKRTSSSCEAGTQALLFKGYKNARRKVREPPQDRQSFSESALSPANQLPRASLNHLLSASMKNPPEDEAE